LKEPTIRRDSMLVCFLTVVLATTACGGGSDPADVSTDMTADASVSAPDGPRSPLASSEESGSIGSTPLLDEHSDTLAPDSLITDEVLTAAALTSDVPPVELPASEAQPTVAAGPHLEEAKTFSRSAGPTKSGDELLAIWHSNFLDGLADWPNRTTGWGDINRTFTARQGIDGQVMKVFYPAGSIDPGTMKKAGLPFGGTGFKSTFSATGYETARLSYKIRFPADFEQGLGGKLPGLCAGTCNTGGKLPDGTDGFSVRYMWTGNFAASIYAYLPTSVSYGTPIGSRKIPLSRGNWIRLTQEVKLNTVGQANGHIRVWADGVLVVDADALTFRSTSNLKITTILFDTFYGGHTPEWAAPKDTTIEFAEFSLSVQ
jgi:hypothetical protein